MSPQGPARHLATPRTLLFLERGGEWLFLEGAKHKWFAGQLNGLGGSVDEGEDVFSAARREAREETGLEPRGLELAAVVHVLDHPAVLLFVFTGRLPPGDLRPTREGTHYWLPLVALDDLTTPFVPDLRKLIPRLLEREPGRLLSLTLRPPDDLR